MAFLTTSFYFSKIGHENVFCDILGKKNAFLGYKKKKFKKPKNCDFSKGVNPWFWYKNGHFSNSFFRKNGPGKCLLRSSRTKKNAFLGYKSRKIKKWKNWYFSKEVNPWFWSKNGHYFNFFFSAISARKMCFTIF